jgi:pimeloyl-ACP methyl ester carboxylesterase
MFLLCPVVEPDFAKRRVAPERVLAREPELVFESSQEQAAFIGETVFQTADLLARWRAAMESGHRRQDHAFVAATRARYVMARPHVRALGELVGPVSVICGRDDAWAGFEDQLHLVRAIRGATFVVLPRCGHLPQLEAHAALAPHFLRWLADL